MSSLLLLAQANNGDGFFGGLAVLTIFFIFMALAASIFWIWMLIDALVNERTTEQKLLWFLVIFFLHVVGAIIYLAVRKSGRARALP